jgi:hypothetical protein
MKKTPKTVAFQLDATSYRRLEEYGKKHKMSAGQYARELVSRALDSDKEDLLDALNLLAQKMDDTHADIKNFRGDFSNDLKEIVKILRILSERSG